VISLPITVAVLANDPTRVVALTSVLPRRITRLIPDWVLEASQADVEPDPRAGPICTCEPLRMIAFCLQGRDLHHEQRIVASRPARAFGDDNSAIKHTRPALTPSGRSSPAAFAQVAGASSAVQFQSARRKLTMSCRCSTLNLLNRSTLWFASLPRPP
jgi:hypothetical protein